VNNATRLANALGMGQDELELLYDELVTNNPDAAPLEITKEVFLILFKDYSSILIDTSKTTYMIADNEQDFVPLILHTAMKYHCPEEVYQFLDKMDSIILETLNANT